MVNGLDHYQQIIKNYDQRISHGQRVSRIESMEYHTARRELYLHQAMEARENGDNQAYNFLNSRAEECNMELITLQIGDSHSRPARRHVRSIDDFGRNPRHRNRRQSERLVGISS